MRTDFRAAMGRPDRMCAMGVQRRRSAVPRKGSPERNQGSGDYALRTRRARGSGVRSSGTTGSQRRGQRSTRRPGISSEDILHRVATGDPAAVRECISRYGGLVWSLARRVGLSESEAEDGVQEVFTSLWQNASRYDPTIASETAFVATIARRRLIDRRRKVGRRPGAVTLSEEITGGGSAAGGGEVSEQAARSAEALSRLSDEQQRVLRLSVYEGLSHELISRATGLPLGTVKTHARRGLIRLREMLSGDMDTETGHRSSAGGER